MSSSTICEICCKEPQKYCCPRCNILYCSLNCYKNPKHATCSESFYRECVVNEFNQRQQINGGASNCDKDPNLQEMYDILKRQQFDDSNSSDDLADSDDDDDEESGSNVENLSERLQGIDINDSDAVWQSLSSTEREEFEKLIKSDEVHTIIPSYEPWWCTLKLIEEVKAESSSSINIPTIVPVIKDFSAISTKPPAPCIEFNLINILSAYAIIVRCYNGDHLQDNCYETANLFIEISENLLTMANFPNQSMAIDSVVNAAENLGLLNDGGESIHKTLEDDVKKIIGKGTSMYVLAALSDVYRIFTIAGSKLKMKSSDSDAGGEFTKKFLSTSTVSVDKSKLNACKRKIEYMLSYAKDIKINKIQV